MSGEMVRKRAFAQSFDIHNVIDTESADGREKKDPIGDRCNALIRRNG